MQSPDDIMSRDPATRASLSEQTLRRICCEYLEMPGLRLTLPQAKRLWGLDEPTCRSLLTFLVNVKFLVQVDDEVYARLTEGAVSLPSLRMAKVDTASPPRSSTGHVRRRIAG
jgi:hypothetical protein